MLQWCERGTHPTVPYESTVGAHASVEATGVTDSGRKIRSEVIIRNAEGKPEVTIEVLQTHKTSVQNRDGVGFLEVDAQEVIKQLQGDTKTLVTFRAENGNVERNCELCRAEDAEAQHQESKRQKNAKRKAEEDWTRQLQESEAKQQKIDIDELHAFVCAQGFSWGLHCHEEVKREVKELLLRWSSEEEELEENNLYAQNKVRIINRSIREMELVNKTHVDSQTSLLERLKRDIFQDQERLHAFQTDFDNEYQQLRESNLATIQELDDKKTLLDNILRASSPTASRRGSSPSPSIDRGSSPSRGGYTTLDEVNCGAGALLSLLKELKTHIDKLRARGGYLQNELRTKQKKVDELKKKSNKDDFIKQKKELDDINDQIASAKNEKRKLAKKIQDVSQLRDQRW